jgi:hypothetical protein
MAHSVLPGRPRSRAARFDLPRPHRLFVAFDDRASADAGVRALGAGGLDAVGQSPEEIWFFEGASGEEELDPGRAGGPSRLFAWVLSHNVEYLEELRRTVADGHTVVALPARPQDVAEELARTLRGHGGRALAYTAHWNFVPVGA